MVIHTIQKGDTVESLAEQYKIPVSRIELDNNLPPGYGLNIGQAVMIAPPLETYTVKNGDTLESIAASNNVTVIDILRYNLQLSDRTTLPDGSELVISYDTNKKIQVAGYSTEYISDQILRKTLPLLTYLIILNYRVDGVGYISELNDDRVIRTAKEYGVAPIMFLSAMTETGKGSYATTNAIINNSELQNTVIDNVLFTMRKKGFVGLNLAFYSILPEDLPLYAEFVSNVTSRLNPLGYEVFITITPHTMGYQSGAAFDSPYYSLLGNAANKVILITYQWQQGSIFQFSQTTYQFLKEQLDYVVTQIPSEKILIGFTEIAYDWEFPYVEGETFGTALTNAAAINLANQLGAVIEYDENTQTPYFNYNSSGLNHFVWFKDARSIIAKLSLIEQYQLAGITIWNILYFDPSTWLSLNTTYKITKYNEIKPLDNEI